jgi:hypothetical protein
MEKNMNKILLSLIAVAGLVVFTSTASAGHPYARPSCGGHGYGGGYQQTYYRPQSSIGFSYNNGYRGGFGNGVPMNYGYNSYYRALPTYSPGYGYGNYNSYPRSGASFSIRF